MSTATSATKRGGNTKPPAKQCRKWCFTWNNYTDDEFVGIETWLRQRDSKFILGKEIGESGTPHIQGYIEFKGAIRFDTLKKAFPKCHFETAKGNVKQNFNYCSKESNYTTNIEVPETPDEVFDRYMKSEYENVVWKDWQQQIIDIVESKPDKRTVHWFWEETGNVGKSFLAMYLSWKYDAIIANGKQGDIFNQYKSYLDEKKKHPKLALIDVPRSHESYVCYSTFEKIKDGMFYSGKYEGGCVRLIPHHLVCFANFEPNRSQLSTDRWNVVYIPSPEVCAP